MAQHGKLTGLMTPLEKVVRVANSAAETAHRAETRKAGSIYVPNSDGTWTVIGEAAGEDETGNPQAIKTFVGDETPPSAPVGVSWESSYGDITAVWGGKLTDGTPADFDHVEFRAGDTLIGRLKRPGSVSAYLTEGQTYSCTAVAVDVQGNESDATAAVDVTCINTFTDVRGEVDKAQQAASDAAQAAAKAEATVDGKNSVFASADTPTARAQGDLWFVLDASGDVTGVKIWDGSTWADYQLVADSVVVPSSIGDTLIADGAVTTEKIYAGAVTAEKISVEDLSALKATIGGTTIDTDSVHTVGKTGIDDDTPGLYLDSEGQLALGDGNSSIKFYRAGTATGWEYDQGTQTITAPDGAVYYADDGTVTLLTGSVSAENPYIIDVAESTGWKLDINFENDFATTEQVNTLIRASGDGVEVGRKVDGAYTGTRALMDSEGFHVLDSDGTERASFEADSIELGKGNESAVVRLVDDTTRIEATGTTNKLYFNVPETSIPTSSGTQSVVPRGELRGTVESTARRYTVFEGIRAELPGIASAAVTAYATSATDGAGGVVQLTGNTLGLAYNGTTTTHNMGGVQAGLTALLQYNPKVMRAGTVITTVDGPYGAATLLSAARCTSMMGHTAQAGNTVCIAENGDTNVGAYIIATRMEGGAVNVRVMSTDSPGTYAAQGATVRINYLLISFAG